MPWNVLAFIASSGSHINILSFSSRCLETLENILVFSHEFIKCFFLHTISWKQACSFVSDVFFLSSASVQKKKSSLNMKYHVHAWWSKSCNEILMSKYVWSVSVRWNGKVWRWENLRARWLISGLQVDNNWELALSFQSI